MIHDDSPANDEELREAELLARALEEPARPGRDVAQIDDALGAAWMLRASRRMDLGDVPGRAALERAWPRPRRVTLVRRAVVAVAAAAAAVAVVAVRPRGPAKLPFPSVQLLRAQLTAARPGSETALRELEHEQDAHRTRVYEALRRAYGGSP